MDLNKVILIGRLGQDPEIKTLPNGNLVCNLNLVTETVWKKDGERQTKAEWHKIVTFDQNIITYCQNYLNMGDMIYIEGKLTYRTIESQDMSGKKTKLVEISVGKYNGIISLFKKKRTEDGKNEEIDSEFTNFLDDTTTKKSKGKKSMDDFDDDTIPFDV